MRFDATCNLKCKTCGPQYSTLWQKEKKVAWRINPSNLHFFNKVDKIAVFTSLGGFEALIRGISVITYGFPFYAGWGLTEDYLKYHEWAKRRTKKLTIDELTFIALIKYPFYSSIKFNSLTEVENIIEEIMESNEKKNLEQIIFKYWGILKQRWLTKNKK